MVDGLWEHPDWARQKNDNDNDDDDDGPGLEYIDLDAINNWVVKLTFNRAGEAAPFSGNGFFLNVPDIPDKHVILTAAHNLISNKQRSLNLKVIYNNPFEVDPDDPQRVKYADDKNGAIIELPVDNTERSDSVYISEAYNLGTGDPSVDYGAILIPRTSANGPRGFGFSLKLAYRKSFKGNVHVSGFRADKSNPPIKKTLRPVTSSAANMIYHENHVEYRATTEPGISGSPVWVEYQKYIAVVAIHNQGTDVKYPKRGSLGALLTVDLLCNVFKWLDERRQNEGGKGAKLIREGVQIQVRPGVKNLKKKRPAADLVPPDRGLFLSFMTNTGFGRVRLGSGTKFDWMPGQVDADSVVHYALSTVGERKWLRFNVAAKKYQGVELSEKLDKRGCLLLNVEDKDVKWINLGVETGEKDGDAQVKVKLRIKGTYIKTYDENRETSEVSLVREGGSESNDQFNRFILKDA